MNPLVKLACAAVVILVATLSLKAVPSLVFAAITFLIAFGAARLPVGRFLKTLIPYLTLAVGFFWFYAVTTSHPAEPALLQFGPVRVTTGSLDLAIGIAFRVVTIMSLTVIFLMTTTPIDFILSLIHQAHLNQRIAFGMFAAIRFMPIAENEMTKISQAHRIRGVGERAGLLGSWRRFRRYAIPLLSSIIRMAIRTALAMDLKAFAVYEDRTYLRVTRITRQEILAAVIFISLIVLLTIFMISSGIWSGFNLNIHGQPGR